MLHSGIAPSSKEGQELAGEWWDMLMYISGGDITNLEEKIQNEGLNEDMLVGDKKMLEDANGFIQEAFDIFAKNSGLT